MGNSINKVERAVHGALDYGELERLGLHPWEVLDFSVNANPYGPSPRVREAVANAAIDRYPDRECLELRRAILDYELASRGLPLSSIVCGNGTTELIWAIAHACLRPGLKAAMLGPTFSEYRVARLAAGATVVEFGALAFFHTLSHTGLNVIPSRTHFCLLEVGDAYHVRQQLLARKILVRDGTSFGLPQFVRVATRPMGKWQQLLLALREIV